MARDEVPLSEAPERFFGREKWETLVARLGSRQAALEKISEPDHGWIAFYRQESARSGGPGAARAQWDEETAQMGNGIVEEFTARLIKGELVATGMQPPSIERVWIPPDLWRQLRPNFDRNTAAWESYRFINIRLFEAGYDRDSARNLVQLCAGWLRERREKNGDESKKVLEGEARKEFEEALTTRQFDAAYAAVYGRKRGRPSSTTKK